jgi:hypothetical protein
MPASSTKVKELEKTKETKKKEEHKKTKTKPNTERGRGERDTHTHTRARAHKTAILEHNLLRTTWAFEIILLKISKPDTRNKKLPVLSKPPSLI